MKNETEEIDLVEVLFCLWANKIFIIMTAVFTLLLFATATKIFITPKYTSETSIYVLTRADQNSNSVTASDLTAGSQLTNDYKEIVTSRPVLEQAINTVGVELTTIDLAEKIRVDVNANTRIMHISVTDENPRIARNLANAVREAVASQIVSVMDMDSVNVVEEGNLPTQPSSPNLKKNALIGGLIGFLLSAAFCVLQMLLDDSIKTVEDVERYLGLTVLGQIPLTESEYDGKKKQKKSIVERLVVFR